MLNRIVIVIVLLLGIARIVEGCGLDRWNQRNFQAMGGKSFSGITYGNSTFVTVGNYGTIFTSTDGSI